MFELVKKNTNLLRFIFLARRMNGSVLVGRCVLFALFRVVLLQIEITKVKYGNGKFCVIIVIGCFSVD